MSNRKTNNNNNDIKIVSTSTEMKKLGIITLLLVIIISIFYIIALFASKHTSNLKYVSTTNEESSISYEYILASDILSKPGEYYVLVSIDSKNPWLELYNSAIEDYKSNDVHIPFYKVDLEDVLNKKYISDENVIEKNNLKFAKTTLLKISDGNITQSYEGGEEIYNHISSL